MRAKQHLRLLIALIAALVWQTTSLQAQVVINEITPDPGNYDGQGAEWTELYCPTGTCDISCYVLTDGEEIIVIPDGTVLNAGEYYLIYNSTYFNCATCNWNGWVAPPGTQALDLATCSCTNQTAGSCYAVTWDNNGPGDRVVLFDGSANIVDAVYWNDGARYAPPTDPILESTYAPGGSLTSLGGCTYDPAANFDVPVLPAVPATSDATWEYIGPDIKGCTTSFIRSTDGGATWTTDNWLTPGQTNTLPDYTITILVDGVPQSVPVANLGGTYTIDVCSGTTVGFSADVYGYNQVYNDNDGDTGNQEGGSTRGGSYISATGGVVLTNANGWDTESAPVAPTGIITLTETAAPVSATTTFNLVVKENTQGVAVNANATCGGSGLIIGSGAAAECYIQQTIVVRVAPPLVVSDITIDCPGDAVAGAVNLAAKVSGGLAPYTYALISGTGGSLSSGGVLTLPIGAVGPFTVDVVDASGCYVTQTITVNSNCIAAPPPCPTFAASSAGCAQAAAPYCVGTDLKFTLTGTDLQNGQQVEWVSMPTAASDPYTTGTVVATQTASMMPRSCPQLAGVLYDAQNIAAQGEGRNELVMFNSGSISQTAGSITIRFSTPPATCSSSGTVVLQSSSITSNATTNAYTTTMNTGCSGKFIEVTSNAAIIPPNSNVIVLSATTPNDAGYNWCSLAGSTYYVVYSSSISNGGGNFSNSAARNWCVVSTACSACSQQVSGPTPLGADNSYYTVNSAGTVATNLTGATSAAALQGIANNFITPPNNAACTVATLSPACVTYTIPETACGQTIHIAPRISPALSADACTGDNEPTLPAQSFDVPPCPTATISGESAICEGATTSFDVTLADYGDCTSATVSYSVNGGATQTTAALTITNDVVTVSGIGTATPGMAANGGEITLVDVVFSGCAVTPCSANVSGAYTVTIASNPAAPTASTAEACMGVPVFVNATGGGPSYEWSTTDFGTVFASGSPISYTAMATTTVYVRSLDPDSGCKSTAAAVIITANPLPTAAPTVSAACEGSTLSFAANAAAGTPGYTYAWAEPTSGGTLSSTTGATTTLSNAASADSGTYEVVVTDSKGCHVIETVNVEVVNCFVCPAMSTIITTDNTLCSGDTNDITVTATDLSPTDMIQLIRFDDYQADPYTAIGGTVIATGTAGGTTLSATGISYPTGTTAADYYIYAILSPTPGDAGCRPILQEIVVINSGDEMCVTETTGNSPTLDGSLDGFGYTHVTEVPFAAPMLGGSSTNSDFLGETATDGVNNGYDSGTNTTFSVSGSDIQQFHITYDATYLYLVVEGPDVCNDGIDMFIAIDTDNVTGAGVTLPNTDAPFNKRVDFAGWSPEYFVAIERVQAGSDYAALIAAGGTTVASDNDATTVGAGFQYASNCVGTTEIRIPWADIGGVPPTITGNTYNFAIYTTANDDNYDVFDSAPGTGNAQPFEEIGDQPYDADHCDGAIDPVTGVADIGCDNAESDNTTGNGTGANGREPGSDNTPGDFDTIEEYFQITNLGQLDIDIPAFDPASASACVGSTVDLPANPTITTLPCPNATNSTQESASSFTWYNGTDIAPDKASPVAGTTVTVTATTAYYWLCYNDGCFEDCELFTVSPLPTPTLTASSNSPVCTGNDIILTSTPGGGSGTYDTFIWAGPNGYTSSDEDPATISGATVDMSGDYSVTVTDSNGCTASAVTTVVVNEAPVLAASSNSPVCTGNDIMLTSTPSGGSGTYDTFIWAGPNGYTSSDEDPATISGATVDMSGDYSVTVTDSNGCTASAVTTVVVNESVAAPTVEPVIVCENGSVTITPTGAPDELPALYISAILANQGSVDANGNGTADFCDENITIVNSSCMPIDISGYTISDLVGVRHTFPAGSIVPANGGSIVVFNGGNTFSNTATILYQNMSTNPSCATGVWNNSSETATLSDGATVISTVSYATTTAGVANTFTPTAVPGTYNFYADAGLTTLISTGASLTLDDTTTPSTAANTSVWVAVASNSCCAPIPTEVLITVNTPPVFTLTEATVASCLEDGTIGFETFPATGAYEYSYSIGGTAYDETIATAFAPAASSTTIATTPGTTYWVRLRDIETSCFSDQSIVTAAVPSQPSITMGATPAAICSVPTSVVVDFPYTATSNSPDLYTITQVGTTPEVISGLPTDAALPVSPLSIALPANATPGDYNFTLTVTNSVTGCTSAPVNLTITVNNCFDLALTKVVSGAGPFAPGGSVTFTYTITNQGAIDAYNVEITDYIPAGLILNDVDWVASGAIATNTVAGPIAANSSAQVDITFTIDAAFAGTSIANYGEISSADNDTESDNTPPTDVDSTADNNPENDGTVVDNDIDNTDGDEDDHDVAIIDLSCADVPAPTLPNNPSVCANATSIPALTVSVASGYSVNWYNAGGTLLASNTTTYTPATLATVTVYAEAYDIANPSCVSDTRTPVTLTVNPVPSPSISGASPICAGNSITLTASGGGTYLWNTGATTAAITVSPATNTAYTVVVTNASNCTASASQLVTVNSVAAAIAGPTTVCPTTPITLTASGGGTYLWNTGATTAAISVTTPGTYTVTVTGANSCSQTTSRVVTVGTNCAAACQAMAGTPTATSPCPESDIVITVTGNQTAANYATLVVITNASGVIQAVLSVSSGTATLVDGTLPAGVVYKMYTYNYETSSGAAIPTVGANISTIPTMGSCFRRSTSGVNLTVPAAFAIQSNNQSGEGNAGGITPMYYNVHTINVSGCVGPYSYTWSSTGYVRHSVIASTVNPASASIRILYADNASWQVTITAGNNCEDCMWIFDNDHLNGSNQAVNDTGIEQMDIADYLITSDKCGTPTTYEGSIKIFVEGGVPPYTFSWSGPSTWAGGPITNVPANGATPGVYPNSPTYTLTGLPYGWYAVTVVDSDVNTTNDPQTATLD